MYAVERRIPIEDYLSKAITFIPLRYGTDKIHRPTEMLGFRYAVLVFFLLLLFLHRYISSFSRYPYFRYFFDDHQMIEILEILDAKPFVGTAFRLR